MVLRNLEGHELPFYKFSSMSGGKRKMTPMIALAADQRHSAPDEEKPRNGGNIINTTVVKF